jgi:predicted glycogen debranching enzyme
MVDNVRRMPWGEAAPAGPEPLLTREWLVANGLGGYASGTVAGIVTRRYHGLLIAALPAPLGRMVMLSHLAERLILPDATAVQLGGDERGEGDLDLPGASHLAEFRLELGLPAWRYQVQGVVLEKRLLLPHLQNTVYVSYRLAEGAAGARLELRPSVHFRPHDAPVNAPQPGPYTLTACGDRYELAAASADLPPLHLWVEGEPMALTLDRGLVRDVFYRLEASRGYESCGPLWSPGYFQLELRPGQDVTLVASTEGWETILALRPAAAQRAERERRERLLDAAPARARAGVPGELVLAADQFIITPSGRPDDVARAHAAGDEVRSVIAGYHWFTDWGRDTMIGLEGLTLTTGRRREAGYILRMFAHHVRDGLIPNFFPEGGREGLYHTADATLWFFHALDRYFQATGDQVTLRRLLPTLLDIVDHHRRGTRFGIGVDPRDGLLRQGQEGYQLTWMDAKVDDWVVTPRRGKAVEINALWYNALCLLAGWVRAEQGDAAARPLAEQAEEARASFNARFWYADGGYLYDVVDGEHGDDPACRPNQVFAISLPHPVLDQARWEPVLQVVSERLLTPVGLRSLAPGHPDYKAKYYGDLRSRDAAYHQGTVWGWLAGPFVDAWLKTYPGDTAGARRVLLGFEEHLGEACIGSISEVFDAEAPYTPRGCIAQAWSVAEVLRAWTLTSE